MPRIYVEFAGLKQAGTTCRDVSSKVSDIRSNFKNTIRQLDWDVKFQSDINSTASQLSRKLDAYAAALHSGGMLFLSGILETDVDAVTDRAQQFGFERLRTRTRSGWAVVRFKKK